jgi:hypothetical protein
MKIFWHEINHNLSQNKAKRAAKHNDSLITSPSIFHVFALALRQIENAIIRWSQIYCIVFFLSPMFSLCANNETCWGFLMNWFLCGNMYAIYIKVAKFLISFHSKLANWVNKYLIKNCTQNTNLLNFVKLGTGFMFQQTKRSSKFRNFK